MKDRIKKIRKELEITQQEFANKLGVKRNNIAGYEIGSRSPSDAVISLICREFNVNEEWLRYGNGEMFQSLSKDKQIASFINNALKDEPNSFRKRLISALMVLKESDWIKLGEIVDSLQKGGLLDNIHVLEKTTTKINDFTTENKEAIPLSRKSFDEMTIDEKVEIYRQELKPEEKVMEKSKVSQEHVYRSS